MIRATAIPQKTKTKNECIIADADLEYLAMDNFEAISNNLYLELKHTYTNLSLSDWNTFQINLLRSHSYHTSFCIKQRTRTKEKNI